MRRASGGGLCAPMSLPSNAHRLALSNLSCPCLPCLAFSRPALTLRRCGHCKKLVPEVKRVAKSLKGTYVSADRTERHRTGRDGA